jgi:hypothetical protein
MVRRFDQCSNISQQRLWRGQGEGGHLSEPTRFDSGRANILIRR